MDPVLGGQILSFKQQASASQEFISLQDITAFLRHYWRTIGICLAVSLIIAGFYNATTDPVYTATTQLLIEPKLPQHLQQGGSEVNLSLDTAQLESQIAVMQSEKIASMVIDELKLVDDPGFNRSHSPSFQERLMRMKALILLAIGMGDHDWVNALKERFSDEEAMSEPLSDYQHARLTSSMFHKVLDVRRVGVSYAINISITSLDPEEAARIANATANAFVREQIETKAEAAKQGGYWLEKRLEELRAQMNEAMAQAQAFRSRHDYSVGNGSGSEDGEGYGGGQNPPTLEELEVTAETYRKMYESFLQAYTNSVSQQSYPVADARVITVAMAPLVPSAPRPKLMLAFAGVAGIVLGVGLAFIRHVFDRTIRSPRQIRDNLGVECVGQLPPASLWSHKAGIDEVVRRPHSAYSHHLRNARTEISLASTDQPVRFLGLTAPTDDGAKTVIASNIATLFAMSGLKTLVIDADIPHSGMTRRLLGAAGTKKTPLQETLKLNIIPAPGRPFDFLSAPMADLSKLVAARNMQAFLAELSEYDMVIIDLPSFESAPDMLACGSALDGVVMVAQWGKTRIDTLRDLARSLQANRTLLFGVLIANSRAITARNREI